MVRVAEDLAATTGLMKDPYADASRRYIFELCAPWAFQRINTFFSPCSGLAAFRIISAASCLTCRYRSPLALWLVGIRV